MYYSYIKIQWYLAISLFQQKLSFPKHIGLFDFFTFADDKNDPKSKRVIDELENIDDDCDRQGIILVKLDNPQEAAQYGIEEIPSLVYFEDAIPHLYQGNLENEDEVLGWLLHQLKTDEIEHVTDEMLDLLKIEHKYVAALFCKLNIVDYLIKWDFISVKNDFVFILILIKSRM